jgi:hypothetical protein
VYGDTELDKESGEIAQPLGEDVYFSLKAAEAGFNLWVDTRASLLHYVPHFIGLPEDLPFTQTRSEDLRRELEAVRQEYLKREANAIPVQSQS